MATLARTQHKVSPCMSESVTPRLHAGCLPSRGVLGSAGGKARPGQAGRLRSTQQARPRGLEKGPNEEHLALREPKDKALTLHDEMHLTHGRPALSAATITTVTPDVTEPQNDRDAGASFKTGPPRGPYVTAVIACDLETHLHGREPRAPLRQPQTGQALSGRWPWSRRHPEPPFQPSSRPPAPADAARASGCPSTRLRGGMEGEHTFDSARSEAGARLGAGGRLPGLREPRFRGEEAASRDEVSAERHRDLIRTCDISPATGRLPRPLP